MPDNDGTRLVVQRETLTQAAFVVAATISDPATPEDRREAARKVAEDLGFWLMFGDGRADGVIQLEPAGFKWGAFYSDLVEEFLLDLGCDVVEDHPALAEMARHAAELVDE
jgi:hypothetical protein